MIEPEQETIDATEDISIDDGDDDSDDDDESFSDTNKHRKRYSLFEDEEESDDPGTLNTLGKESGHKKIVGIDSQDAAATDNETTRQLLITSAINQITSLQQQTNQTQQVTTKEPQMRIYR